MATQNDDQTNKHAEERNDNASLQDPNMPDLPSAPTASMDPATTETFETPSSKKRTASEALLTFAQGFVKKSRSDIQAERAQEYLDRLRRQRLSFQQLTRSNGSRPVSLVDQATRKNWDDKIYRKALDDLSKELPTDAQKLRLQAAKTMGPNYLGRTASKLPGRMFNKHSRRSNGFTSSTILMPAADVYEKEEVHNSITDLTQGELVYMLGQHLVWNDIHGDEFLSYSKDPLFLVVHALNRAHSGEGDVTIQFFDRRQAKAWDRSPAAFYPALELYDIFEVPKWHGWQTKTLKKLHPRKFTQELLSHGTIVLDPSSSLKQAPLNDLIRDGLFKIFPELEVAQDHERAGLYTGQVVFRRIGYPPGGVAVKRFPRLYSYAHCARTVAMTEDLLKTVRKVTMNFIRLPEGGDGAEQVEPPLHIFLCFLTFHKRERRNAVFLAWIKARYTATDVKDLYTDSHGDVLTGFTTIANNLPGYMQYVSLIRDCIELFGGLPALPPNVTETEHALHGYQGRDYRYADYDSKHHMGDQISKPWSASLQLLQRLAASAKRRAKTKEAKKAREKMEQTAETQSGDVVKSSETASQLSGEAEAAADSEAEVQEEVADFRRPMGKGAETASRSVLEDLILA